MRVGVRLLVAAVAGSVLIGAMPAVAETTASGATMERVIVRLKPSAGETRQVAKQLMSDAGGTLGPVFGHVLKGFAAKVPAGRLAALRSNPRVAEVVADGQIRPAEVPNGVKRAGADRIAGTKIGTGTAVDVDIAILDTGVNAHADLTLSGGVDCTKDTGCTTGGFTDNHGHGTHVAGTAAAKDNGAGVVGTAPGARVWAVKVLPDSGPGQWSWFISGLDWVAGRGTIEVVNASLGGGQSSAVDTAVANATAAGVVVVVAAGNDAIDAAAVSPASAANAITVSAFGDTDGFPGGLGGAGDDVFAGFSNYGAVVDIAAPGVGIYSTDRSGGYSYKQGTSMASPHVAGAAAVYVAQNAIAPSSTRWQTVLNGLRGEWAAGQSSTCGFTGGRSAEPVLVMGGCSGGDTVPPSTVTITPVAGDKHVALTWTASTDASGVASYRVYRAKGTTGAFALLATVDGGTTAYTDLAVLNKTLYRYQVRAHDTAANYSTSAIVAATPADRIPPPGTTADAVPHDRSVVLTWTPVTDSSGMKGYEVWRSLNGAPWVRRALAGRTAVTYKDIGLTNGMPVYYTIRPVDAAGNFGPYSDTLSAVPFDDAAPTLPVMSVVVGDGRLTVKWSAAKDSTGVAAYHVYTAVGSEPFGAPVTVSGSTLTHTFTGLTNGTVYRFAMAATDVLDHTSAQTKPRLVAPKDLTGPAAVTASGSVGAGAASLTWTGTTDPSGVGSYRIYRGIGTGTLRSVASVSAAAARQWQQTGLIPGTSYRFVVRPVDTKGNVGAESNVITGTA